MKKSEKKELKILQEHIDAARIYLQFASNALDNTQNALDSIKAKAAKKKPK